MELRLMGSLANITIKGDSQALSRLCIFKPMKVEPSDWDSIILLQLVNCSTYWVFSRPNSAGSSLNIVPMQMEAPTINFYDATGGNNFVKNGVEIDASAGAWLSASDLANITVRRQSNFVLSRWYYSAWDSIVLVCFQHSVLI